MQAATHRHRGIDFILITQGSGLLDTNIKKLVKGGLHIFLRSSYIGRHRYEKSEVIDEESKASYSLAARRKYVVPKDVFPLYTSAELHTKPPRAKLPLAAFVVVLALIGGGLLAWKLQDRVSTAMNGEKAQPVGAASAAASPTTEAAQFGPSAPAPTLTRSPADYVPTVPYDPATAPRFDTIRKEVDFPRIASCGVSKKRGCLCFTQQATLLKGVPEDYCTRFAAGEIFDAYSPPAVASSPAASSASVINAKQADDGHSQPVNGQDVPRSPEGGEPPSGSRVS